MSLHDIYRHFAVAIRPDIVFVEIIDYFFDFVTVGIHLKNLFDDGGSKFVLFVAMLGVDFVTESNLSAVTQTFQHVFGHTAGNLFGEFGGVIFSHSFK